MSRCPSRRRSRTSAAAMTRLRKIRIKHFWLKSGSWRLFKAKFIHDSPTRQSPFCAPGLVGIQSPSGRGRLSTHSSSDLSGRRTECFSSHSSQNRDLFHRVRNLNPAWVCHRRYKSRNHGIERNVRSNTRAFTRDL